MDFTKIFPILTVILLSFSNTEGNECRKKSYVGLNCTSSNQCFEKFNSYCDESTQNCECKEGWYSMDGYLCFWETSCKQPCLNNQFCNNDKGTCDEKLELLGQTCTGYGQCSAANSFCDLDNKCNCIIPYKPNANNTACVLCDEPQKCNSTSECSSGYFCDDFLSICRANKLTLGDVCTEDHQCSSDNSFCCLDMGVTKGHCKCNAGHDSTDGVSCVSSENPQISKHAVCAPFNPIVNQDPCLGMCTNEQYCQYNGWYYYCEQKPYVGDKCPGYQCFSENAACNDIGLCTCNDFYELSLNKTCEYKPTSCSSGCPKDTHYCDEAKGLCRKKRFLGGICSEVSQCIVDGSKCDILLNSSTNCDAVGRCMCETTSELVGDYYTCKKSPQCSSDATCASSFGDTYYCHMDN